jgi:hypothetical protein
VSKRTIDFLVDLNVAVNRHVGYVIRMEPGVQTPEETLTIGSGSCRDSAWLLVQAARRLGFAARFVSGYSIQLTPDIVPIDGPKGVAQDVCDLHAWAEVYRARCRLDRDGRDLGHVRGRGAYPACRDPAFSLGDADRGRAARTRPCRFPFRDGCPAHRRSGAHHQALHRCALGGARRLGEKVDADLVAQDVRLTMGGEPTFVALDDAEAPEWNGDAVGPTKAAVRRHADPQAARSLSRPAACSIMARANGIPAKACRAGAIRSTGARDGVPVWRDASLIAGAKAGEAVTGAEAGIFLTGSPIGSASARHGPAGL